LYLCACGLICVHLKYTNKLSDVITGETVTKLTTNLA
jgi:hypothetical protein